MSEAEQTLKNLESLFAEAERKRLWFYCSYQELWFSPKELREEQANGSFVWGPVNWVLRDPMERLEELMKATESARQTQEAFALRVAQEGKTR